MTEHLYLKNWENHSQADSPTHYSYHRPQLNKTLIENDFWNNAVYTNHLNTREILWWEIYLYNVMRNIFVNALKRDHKDICIILAFILAFFIRSAFHDN